MAKKIIKSAPGTKNNTPKISSEMMKLVATVANDVTIQNYGDVLRPQDDTIAKKGGSKGLRLYEEVERDGRVKAMLEKRKGKVQSREWVVLPDDDDDPQAQEAAKLVESAFRKIALSRINGDLLDATLMGVSFGEVVWHVRNNMILPQKINKHRAARFVFDKDWNPRLLTPEATSEGIALPDRKFIVHRHDADGSDPYGRGLGRILFWNVLFKREGVGFWAHFQEKFASPTPFGKYPLGTPPSEVDRIEEMLINLAQSGVIIMPLGSEIEFLESANAETMSFENWCRYWDEESAITILGETLSTSLDGAGSRAAAETHMEVSDGLADNDADVLSETYNETLVRWIVDLNMPGAPYPTIWFPRTKNETAIEDLKKKRAERQKAEMENLEAAKAAGFIPAEGLNATYSEIFEKEMMALPVLTVSTQQTSFAEKQSHKHDRDDVDHLVDQADKAMQPIIDNWLDIVRQKLKEAVSKGESLKEFRDSLLSVYPEIQQMNFADILSQVMIVADLTGRDDVLDEGQDA